MGPDEGVYHGPPSGTKAFPKAEQKVWEEFIQILEKRDETEKSKRQDLKPKARQIGIRLLG